MKTLSAFDVIGPSMVGPSSSHTAGAARIGAVARRLTGDDPVSAEFTLFGSFAHTYAGHGTDRALVAGLLGLAPDDERLPFSFELAAQQGVSFRFRTSEAPTEHPNTVGIRLTGRTGAVTRITAVSLGGGAIMITQLQGVDVSITGEYPTLMVEHKDQPGMIGEITRLLGDRDINSAFMRVFRHERGGQAFMVIETDHMIPPHIVQDVASLSRGIGGVYIIEGV